MAGRQVAQAIACLWGSGGMQVQVGVRSTVRLTVLQCKRAMPLRLPSQVHSTGRHVRMLHTSCWLAQPGSSVEGVLLAALGREADILVAAIPGCKVGL